MEQLGVAFLSAEVYRGQMTPEDSYDPRVARAIGELLVNRSVVKHQQAEIRQREAMNWAMGMLEKLESQLPMPVEKRRPLARDPAQCLMAFIKREEWTKATLKAIREGLSDDSPKLLCPASKEVQRAVAEAPAASEGSV